MGFVMKGVEKFIADNGLVLNITEVASNPYLPHEASDMKHCLCQLSGDNVSGFEFYFSFVETDSGYVPDIVFVMSRLLEDVRSFRDCEGYGDFARLIGIDEDDPRGVVAFEEVERLSKLIDQNFGFDNQSEAGLQATI